MDFVAIGDITIDDFINLNPEDACIDEKNNKLCVNFGDKVPYESHKLVPSVGNSPNAAVAAHRLGLESALITDIGDDKNGDVCLEALEKEGVNTKYVTRHKGRVTNYHYVLRYKAERTILVKHEEYDYKMPNVGSPTWMYLSSLSDNSLPYHEEIAAYLKKNGTKLAFQPGTFQMKLGYEKLKELYELSELFFCNKEEAQKILNTEESDIKELLKGIKNLGPNISIITDGRDGAYTYDGEEIWHIPMYPDPEPPVDRTGAGDSFSSTLTSALALGKTVQEALTWGPINSMSVVQYIGAQEGLLTQEKIKEYLKTSPSDYIPNKLT